MSFAEDMGYDSYDPPEAMDDVERLFITTNNGTRVCANCGSKNIKVSKKGNDYCADLCWVKSDEDEAMGMSFQDWRTENDHE